jgi:hypothetical protein
MRDSWLNTLDQSVRRILQQRGSAGCLWERIPEGSSTFVELEEHCIAVYIVQSSIGVEPSNPLCIRHCFKRFYNALVCCIVISQQSDSL